MDESADLKRLDRYLYRREQFAIRRYLLKLDEEELDRERDFWGIDAAEEARAAAQRVARWIETGEAKVRDIRFEFRVEACGALSYVAAFL